MYKVRLSAQARRELKKISLLHRMAVDLAFQDLSEDPFQGKKLARKLTDRFSYRIGIYRLIYKINTNDRTVDILTAGHRSIVYNN